MDIYENIVIGNFLYSLGMAMGARGEARGLPLSVNLLQQTPLDRSAGDVLVRGSRAMRLLEFKRERNDDDKEDAKLTQLERMLSAPEHTDLMSVSREVHWFIRSKNADGTMQVKIVPYLDFKKAGVAGPELRSFIHDIVSEAMQEAPDKSALHSRYLDVVAKSQGSIKGSSGGMIVSVDQEGIVNYAIVEDLRELGMPLTRLHAIYAQRQAERQREYEAHWSRTFSPSKGYEREQEKTNEQGLSR